MKGIEQQVGITDLKPRDYFNLIRGASAGGLIVIMSGILGMVYQSFDLC